MAESTFDGAGHGEAAGESLPVSHRLRKRGEFQIVQDQGQRFASAALVLLLRPNDLGHRRLGVTVSSKVGNAVVRGQVKRWFREIFRKHRSLLPPSMDVILIARGAAPDAGYHRLLQDFERAAAQARRRFAQGQQGPATGRGSD